MTQRDALLRRLHIQREEAQREVNRLRLADARSFFSALHHLHEVEEQFKRLTG